jgi:pimeloyl-ACP methyl ester carboxylesterase
MSDVIVLLPGILGSELQKHGKTVWGLSAGSMFRALRTVGGSLKDLELKNDSDDPVSPDGVTASRVIPDVHLVPGLSKIDGYTKIAHAIKAGFDVSNGANFFEFPYDWRRSNRVAARRLQSESTQWLETWRKNGHPNAKLILIGHSMGGLVARYFLEVLGGWDVTRSLITFGTPHRGSVNALNFIANGFKKKILGIEVLDLSLLLRSLPSVYELLPIYPCCDVDGGELVRISDAKVPNMDAAKRDAALQFHKEIRDGVTKRGTAFDSRVHPIVGTKQPTLQSAQLRNGAAEVLMTLNNEDMGGDGTVPRVSATPIELSDASRDVFSAERHASLQNNDGVLTQVEGILKTGSMNLSAFQRPTVSLAVGLDDAYEESEPVVITARPDAPVKGLQAQITNLESSAKRIVTLMPNDDGRHIGEIPPLSAGTYRVVVYGDTRVQPVTDVFLVG